ncbi:MAG: carboxypeptidase-like regulatory domain-containing protein [Planctomycetaceae bacterium]
MRIAPFVLLACLSFSAGCGTAYGPRAEQAASVPAAGVVIWKGQPLAGFRITLHPGDNQRPASGVTDAEGRFVLGTNSLDDGAVPGTHKVSVIPELPVDDGLGSAPTESAALKTSVELPAKFASPESSGLTLEVPVGGSSSLQLTLQ